MSRIEEAQISLGSPVVDGIHGRSSTDIGGRELHNNGALGENDLSRRSIVRRSGSIHGLPQEGGRRFSHRGIITVPRCVYDSHRDLERRPLTRWQHAQGRNGQSTDEHSVQIIVTKGDIHAAGDQRHDHGTPVAAREDTTPPPLATGMGGGGEKAVRRPGGASEEPEHGDNDSTSREKFTPVRVPDSLLGAQLHRVTPNKRMLQDIVLYMRSAAQSVLGEEFDGKQWDSIMMNPVQSSSALVARGMLLILKEFDADFGITASSPPAVASAVQTFLLNEQAKREMSAQTTVIRNPERLAELRAGVTNERRREIIEEAKKQSPRQREEAAKAQRMRVKVSTYASAHGISDQDFQILKKVASVPLVELSLQATRLEDAFRGYSAATPVGTNAYVPPIKEAQDEKTGQSRKSRSRDAFVFFAREAKAGRIHKGTTFSASELASAAGINVSIMLRVIDRFTELGILSSEAGSGYTVIVDLTMDVLKSALPQVKPRLPEQRYIPLKNKRREVGPGGRRKKGYRRDVTAFFVAEARAGRIHRGIEFTVADLADVSGIHHKTVRREARRLVGLGILSSEAGRGYTVIVDLTEEVLKSALPQKEPRRSIIPSGQRYVPLKNKRREVGPGGRRKKGHQSDVTALFVAEARAGRIHRGIEFTANDLADVSGVHYMTVRREARRLVGLGILSSEAGRGYTVMVDLTEDALKAIQRPY